jgi:hypothetical protein
VQNKDEIISQRDEVLNIPHKRIASSMGLQGVFMNSGPDSNRFALKQHEADIRKIISPKRGTSIRSGNSGKSDGSKQSKNSKLSKKSAISGRSGLSGLKSLSGLGNVASLLQAKNKLMKV